MQYLLNTEPDEHAIIFVLPHLIGSLAAAGLMFLWHLVIYNTTGLHYRYKLK